MSDGAGGDRPGSDGGQGPRRGLSSGPIRRGRVARAAIRTVRLTLRAALLAAETLLALIIVFEEWGWRPLSAALAALARIRLVARLEAAVTSLPPWPALGVFLVPSVLFLPLKLASLWLIANGRLVSAAALFVFAKIAGTALYARIFQLTQPALMRLAWFAVAYNWFMPWKERIIAHARGTAVWRAGSMAMARMRTAMQAAWQRLAPRVMPVVMRLRALLVR